MARRVFDAQGRLVAVSHHFGKNPYAGLDPLGLQPNMPMGELASFASASCLEPPHARSSSFKSTPLQGAEAFTLSLQVNGRAFCRCGSASVNQSCLLHGVPLEALCRDS